jgi:hypothetical protein
MKLNQLIASQLIQAGLVNADQQLAIEQALAPIVQNWVIRPSEEAILKVSQDVALSEYCSEMPEIPFDQLIEELQNGEFPCIVWQPFEDYSGKDFATLLCNAQENVKQEIEGLFPD